VNAARVILCLNSGSSSRKFALYRFGESKEHLLAEGAVEHIGAEGGRLWIHDGLGNPLSEIERDFPEPKAALQLLFAEVQRLNLPAPAAIGHRMVHGGPHHSAPERITPELIEDLRRVIAFAPLHIPPAIEAIEAATSRFHDVPQVACFDTDFHRQMPELARRFALPRSFWNEGIRRYGFHGISYEYIVQMLGRAIASRTVIAHLGNGASMSAVRDGRPIDTTMGFTPTGGFMMGTRSGDLDPGIAAYLLNQKDYDGRRLEQLVNHESGLLGVSGISSDMKTLLEKQASEPSAAMAVEMFCYQLRKQIGSFAAALGGIDLLVFTGGIGERAAPIRREVCLGLQHLGIQLDLQANEAHADVISSAQSACLVRVIPTNEDLMIARHTYRLVFREGATC
jgi:acetate kinase